MTRAKAIGPCTPAPIGSTRRSRGLLAGAMLLSLLAGCRDAPSTMVVFSRDDPWSFAQADMVKSGLPVVIRGRIGDGNDGQFEAGVVDAIRRAMTWTAKPDVRWVKRAPPRSVRIIAVFGGAAGGPGACADETDGAVPPADAAATLTMLLCAGDERIAEVAGRFGRATRADDPRFAALIRQATSDLFAR